MSTPSAGGQDMAEGAARARASPVTRVDDTCRVTTVRGSRCRQLVQQGLPGRWRTQTRVRTSKTAEGSQAGLSRGPLTVTGLEEASSEGVGPGWPRSTVADNLRLPVSFAAAWKS